MKRVLIIGSPGAGKSTLAKRLHNKTGLKLLHLDMFYHLPNWNEPSKENWLKTVIKLVQSERWIMDGNYGGTMDLRLGRCDTVVWLDYPRLICTWRVLKRTFLYRDKTRSDMADSCKERFDWEFLKYVWNFPRDKNRNIDLRLKSHDHVKVYRLKSNREVRDFLEDINDE